MARARAHINNYQGAFLDRKNDNICNDNIFFPIDETKWSCVTYYKTVIKP
jgi:hypothetical protein